MHQGVNKISISLVLLVCMCFIPMMLWSSYFSDLKFDLLRDSSFTRIFSTQNHVVIGSSIPIHITTLPDLCKTWSLDCYDNLDLINRDNANAINLNLTNHKPNSWIDLTAKRLQIRVDKKLLREEWRGGNQNSTPLHSSTISDERNPVVSEKLHLSRNMYDGGLGNYLFQVAGLVGMSVKNMRFPSLLDIYGPDKYFPNLQIDRINRSQYLGNHSGNGNDWTIFENGWGKYSPQMENVTLLQGRHNVLISGYMQSWKYFDFIRDHIRYLFTFHNSTYQKAVESITKVLYDRVSAKIVTLPSLIGVHVRRGDTLDPVQMKHGHKPASDEYLLRAALHFQKAHPNVIFVVISNDMPYCKKLFVDPHFYFMEYNDAAVDMAILSLMDQIILSVGSYGWWGAYMSDAKEVLYYKDWPRNGSNMAAGINYEDYFLPNWIPLD